MTPKTIDISEVPTYLDEMVSSGPTDDEIIISKDEKPVARLVPIAARPYKERKMGLGRGEVWMSDDFDDPLPDEFWLGEE